MSRGPRYTPEEDRAILDAFTPRSVRIELAPAGSGEPKRAIRRRYQRLVNRGTPPFVARSRDKAIPLTRRTLGTPP